MDSLGRSVRSILIGNQKMHIKVPQENLYHGVQFIVFPRLYSTFGLNCHREKEMHIFHICGHDELATSPSIIPGPILDFELLRACIHFGY